MSDLTERLRDDAKRGNPGWHVLCNRQCNEAADRIDELEAALRDIEEYGYRRYPSIVIARTARQALGDNDE